MRRHLPMTMKATAIAHSAVDDHYFSLRRHSLQMAPTRMDQRSAHFCVRPRMAWQSGRVRDHKWRVLRVADTDGDDIVPPLLAVAVAVAASVAPSLFSLVDEFVAPPCDRSTVVVFALVPPYSPPMPVACTCDGRLDAVFPCWRSRRRWRRRMGHPLLGSNRCIRLESRHDSILERDASPRPSCHESHDRVAMTTSACVAR